MQQQSDERSEDTLGLTPAEIVAELDRYVVSQEDAKRAVAIALRNRARRLMVNSELRDEITPKNILMIGPTGVGKTEISRRLAKLVKAPFLKVEASKFTEVGYVGRDVESIVRDLVEASVQLVKEEFRKEVRAEAERLTEEKLLDLLLPGSGDLSADDTAASTRERLRMMLREGKLDERTVEVDVQRQVSTHLEIVGPPGMGEIEGQLKEAFSNLMPKPRDKKRLSLPDARRVVMDEVEEGLLDNEKISRRAREKAEQTGIVFIDEVDKICIKESGGKGPDVSREGVQRDLLPLVEGCAVSTRYGTVRTDHILFIASGAFHVSKPSDLMPEFQGRFPIRVELKSLSASDYVRILSEPKNALTKQYVALLETEGVKLEFAEEALREVAELTAEVNSRAENIGARRLYTLLEKLLEELSFSAVEHSGTTINIDRNYVREKLRDIVKDIDLARFIL